MKPQSNDPNKESGGIEGFTNIKIPIQVNPEWKSFQMERKKKANRHRLAVVLFKSILLLSLVFASFHAFQKLKEQGWLSVFFESDDNAPAASVVVEPEKTPNFTKKVLHDFMNSQPFLNLTTKSLPVFEDSQRFIAMTSLDLPLQNYLLEIMDTTHAKNIAMVVMDPESGKILAMVSHDKNDPKNNSCLDSKFPAASIFKIVTASAAIEKLGYDTDTRLSYNGRKYTLYKSQLKENVTKYTRHLSFQDAFAQSINPVFGKLGTLRLKKKNLETYADAFGFNHEIEFELPVAISRFDISDKPFNWAEIACGFNRITAISPLHGALIAATMLNDGNMPEPLIIEQILDENGKFMYQGKPNESHGVIKKKTSEIIHAMMLETVKSGTSKKAFRKSQKDPILSRLDIGGKTGSIDNQGHDARLDWFVGFAQEKKGSRKITISILVAHQEYIGTRAAEYARKGIKFYFQKYYEEKDNPKKAGSPK